MSPLSCLSLREGRQSRAEGREESPIVPQPSWDVWTQADSQRQRENTPPHILETDNKNRPAPPTTLLPSTTLTPGFLSPRLHPLSLRACDSVCSMPSTRRQTCTYTHTPTCAHTQLSPDSNGGRAITLRTSTVSPLPSRRPQGQRKLIKKGGKRHWRDSGSFSWEASAPGA